MRILLHFKFVPWVLLFFLFFKRKNFIYDLFLFFVDMIYNFYLEKLFYINNNKYYSFFKFVK